MCIYMFLNVCVVTVFMSTKTSTELMFVMLHCKPDLKKCFIIYSIYHGQATGKLYHLFVAASRVHLFFHLQSRARTHVVLVIDLYELLGNPTT
jgi:hypothetical protein